LAVSCISGEHAQPYPYTLIIRPSASPALMQGASRMSVYKKALSSGSRVEYKITVLIKSVVVVNYNIRSVGLI